MLLFGSAVPVLESTPNFSTFHIEVVTIATAGTPVQGPTITVPDGVSIGVIAYNGNGNKKVYVANSSANTADAAKRTELKAGVGLGLRVSNTNLLWFDGSADGLKVELIFEG